MFDELRKYDHKGHFFYSPTDNLKEVCNAPTDKSGVYVIYALKNGRIELIYIGCSGKVLNDGTLFIRNSGLGGIKDRLVNGKQFGTSRKHAWKTIMDFEQIEALDIYWYVTHNEHYVDCPGVLENTLLKRFQEVYGRLPAWNREL